MLSIDYSDIVLQCDYISTSDPRISLYMSIKINDSTLAASINIRDSITAFMKLCSVLYALMTVVSIIMQHQMNIAINGNLLFVL